MSGLRPEERRTTILLPQDGCALSTRRPLPHYGFCHVNDKSTHRMLSPESAVVPSFVMSFISSLTSLEAIKPRAQANAFLCQRKNSFPTPAARDFTLRA